MAGNLGEIVAQELSGNGNELNKNWYCVLAEVSDATSDDIRDFDIVLEVPWHTCPGRFDLHIEERAANMATTIAKLLQPTRVQVIVCISVIQKFGSASHKS